MKPLRIEIKDFGAIAHMVIDFTAISCAAICGPNGAGKSTAITIAPRFALFGVVKAGCSVDDMVRAGTTEAEVIFDFEQNGAVYRVVRTRSTKGKGKSTLELQRQSGELWTSESGASISETQKKIIQLLNLDDETFVASSMILQGRANEFTSRPAGQRKAILSQVLQLDQYETLQEKAKGKVQVVSSELSIIKSKIADIDERLSSQAGFEGDKLQVELQLAKLAKYIENGERQLQDAQVELAGLQAKINQAEQIGQRAKTARDNLILKTAEQDKQQERLKMANQILDKEEAILLQSAEHAQIKDKVTVLRTKQEQQTSINTEGIRLKSELADVETKIKSTFHEIDKLEAVLADQERLALVKEEYDSTTFRLSECQKLNEKDQVLLNAVKDCESKLYMAEDRYLNQEKRYKQIIAEQQEKTNMLADSNCVDIEKAQCKFLADAISAKGKLALTQEQYSQWKINADNEIANLQKELKAAKEVRTTFAYNPLEIYELQEKITKLKPDIDVFTQLGAMAPLLENLKGQKSDLEARQTDLNSRLDKMRTEYQQLAEGLKELPSLEWRLKELEPALAQKERLPVAHEVSKAAKEALDKLTVELDALAREADTLDKEYTVLKGNNADLHQAANNKVINLRQVVESGRSQQTQLTAKMGGIQAKLDGLAEDAKQRSALNTEMEPLTKRLVRWQTLVKAFGRDGIPALIIENAVPELERIANDILGQMSGGRNYLRFETQKELKSRGGMAETLDIIVGDWAGERIYETYSGGEQLRIDFAIRFALAELLARRAGAKVDWLTIDEGFGSQSDEFLPMVIDAVKAVASRFGLVLVISHVKAVQEAFEQKIEFHPAADEGAPIEVKVA